MWRLKGCGKCGGDLFLERDDSGWHEKCLQCGNCSDLRLMAEYREHKLREYDRSEYSLIRKI